MFVEHASNLKVSSFPSLEALVAGLLIGYTSVDSIKTIDVLSDPTTRKQGGRVSAFMG